MIDKDRIEQIKQRADKATPGPWKQDAYLVVAEVPQGRPGGEVIIQCRPSVPRLMPRVQNEADAFFVSHAREDIPYLIDQLTEIDEWEEVYLASIESLTERNSQIRECLNKIIEYTNTKYNDGFLRTQVRTLAEVALLV